MAADGGIHYNEKELFDKIDLRFDDVIRKLDANYNAQNSEIRDVRHRVANLESWKELRLSHEQRLHDDFEELKQEVHTQSQDMKPVFEFVSNARSVEVYRKWLIATALVIMGLLISLGAIVMGGVK